MNHSDRCDGCSAQAYVRVSSGLQFCSHHWAKYEAPLSKVGVTVTVDNRAELVNA